MEADIVRLNVGGRRFMTTTTTLSNYGENMLTILVKHHLAGDAPSPLDEKGFIFIDRNGEIFSLILDYLRSGELTTLHFSQQQIFRELDFFQIAPPKRDKAISQIDKHIQHHVKRGKTIFHRQVSFVLKPLSQHLQQHGGRTFYYSCAPNPEDSQEVITFKSEQLEMFGYYAPKPPVDITKKEVERRWAVYHYRFYFYDPPPPAKGSLCFEYIPS